MPTYEYRCGSCGHELEAVQSFSDPALTECPHCGEPTLRKRFGNVGVVFKGSGFYRNDSRADSKGRADDKDRVAADKSESGSKDAGSKKESAKDAGGGSSTPSPDSGSTPPSAKKAPAKQAKQATAASGSSSSK